jgi:acetylglutamate kinase
MASGLIERGSKWAGAVLGLSALLVVLLAAAGIERKEDHDADIDQLRAEQEAARSAQAVINDQLLRKLDCALFDLPRNCRETMAPRER